MRFTDLIERKGPVDVRTDAARHEQRDAAHHTVQICVKIEGSHIALLPDSGKFVVLRVPYPMGFYAKGMDGRIDDPKAGWKGKGLWATYGTRTPFHAEGGKGTTSKVLHFQLRPDPLAH